MGVGTNLPACIGQRDFLSRYPLYDVALITSGCGVNKKLVVQLPRKDEKGNQPSVGGERHGHARAYRTPPTVRWFPLFCCIFESGKSDANAGRRKRKL